MPLHKPRVLVCGVLPPPYFGHSMLYEMLMRSSFTAELDVSFLDMHFWSYETNRKVTGEKIFKMLKYYAEFLWLLARVRPAYVLYNISFYKMPFLKDLLFCTTAIIFGRKLVIHDHGQYVRELHEALPSWQKGMLRWVLRHMRASIIMGERVRSVYEGLAEPGKLFVVPGTAADTRELTVAPDRQASRNVLYFSHMSRSKGVYVAFEAASLVLGEDRSLHFTFAGPLENDEAARRLTGLQSMYPGRVRYMGYVEDAGERAALFRGADVFFFPTLRDVFGLVLLHAMAEGVAVVASREGTIPEIISDGEGGYLCEKGQAKDFSDKIRMLLNDEGLRRRMGEANRRRYEERYSLKPYGEAMVEVFKKLEEKEGVSV
jgi:glycosyltransferase involved in cell wall biosynthesis